MDITNEVGELRTGLEDMCALEDKGIEVVDCDMGEEDCDIKPVIETWQPSDFLPGIYVDKSLPKDGRLLDLAIDFLTEAQLSIMKMQVDERGYLPVCDRTVREEARSHALNRPGPEGILCEALLVQAANYAKTQRWWLTMITHHQMLRHVWARGRHVLYALARPLGLDRFCNSRFIVYDDTHDTLRRGLTDIRRLTIRAQFLVLQMYGLAQIREQWAKRLNLSEGSHILSMSSRQLADAAECLLDWRAAAFLVFTKSRHDWARTCYYQKVPVTDEEFPRVQFTFGNPLNMRLPSNFEGAIAAIWKEIHGDRLQ